MIAPAIWVAAPILPGTPTAAEVRLLALLDEAQDHRIHAVLAQNAGIDPDFDAIAKREPYLVRQLVASKWRDQKGDSGALQTR